MKKPDSMTDVKAKTQRNEYRVTVRGTAVETEVTRYAESEEQAIKYVQEEGWFAVWGELEGENGEVCDHLTEAMPMEVIGCEFVRELPAFRPPPQLYDESIMHSLIGLLTPYVEREAADYAEHGGADHPYRRTHAALSNLILMWNHKGIDVKLGARSPAELDQQREHA